MPGILLLWIFAGLTAVLNHPSWLVKSKWATEFSEKQGIHWRDLQVRKISGSLLNPWIEIRWNSLIVERPGVYASARAGQIDFAVRLSSIPPSLTELGPVRIPLELLKMTPMPNEPRPVAEQKGPAIPQWARQAKLSSIHVTIDQWQVPGNYGSLALSHDTGCEWNLKTTEAIHDGHVDLRACHSSPTIEGGWDVAINGGVKNLSRQIRTVSITECKLKLIADPGGQALNTQCPIRIGTAVSKIEGLKGVQPVAVVGAQFTSHLRSKDFLDSHERIRGDGILQMEPMDPLVRPAKLIKSWGTLRFSGDFAPDEPQQKWNVQSSFDLHLAISRFERLVETLDATNYAVPAPLHALTGNMLLFVQGSLNQNRGEIPLSLLTRLQSANQNFDLAMDGKLLVHRLEPEIASELQAKLVLQNVRIPLPHIDYKALPRLLPDPRIRPGQPRELGTAANRQAAGVTPAFEYHIQVVTENEPVRIQSNLTKEPIPMRLNLSVNSGAPVTGLIHLDPFPLDLFRRDAEVEKMNITLGEKENKLDGMARVEYADYTIRAKLFGTTDDPGVKFLSDPPLPDADVISVLLFGRTSDDLDSSEGESVGSVQSAAANRGLNLASLYLLASTPVESVGYDSQSGAVNVKFKLPAGASLNIAGAQQELESIGVRKRIGRKWALTTQYGNPADPSDRSVSAFLEWSHRY